MTCDYEYEENSNMKIEKKRKLKNEYVKNKIEFDW